MVACGGKQMPDNSEEKRKEFIAALSEAENRGFHGGIVYAHAFHETGGFRHIVGKNNFWGIKKPEAWIGASVAVMTHEYYPRKGRSVEEFREQNPNLAARSKSIEIAGDNFKIFIPDLFIDFPSAKEAISFYCSFIERRYPEAFKNKQDYKAYFRGLICGENVYATDPQYVPKMTKVFESVAGDLA